MRLLNCHQEDICSSFLFCRVLTLLDLLIVSQALFTSQSTETEAASENINMYLCIYVPTYVHVCHKKCSKTDLSHVCRLIGGPFLSLHFLLSSFKHLLIFNPQLFAVSVPPTVPCHHKVGRGPRRGGEVLTSVPAVPSSLSLARFGPIPSLRASAALTHAQRAISFVLPLIHKCRPLLFLLLFLPPPSPQPLSPEFCA